MLSDYSDVAMTIVMEVILFVQPNDYRCVCVTILIGRPEDPSDGCNLQGIFSPTILHSNWPVLSVRLQGSAEIFFRRNFAIERPILTLDHLFDDEQYLTWWSNGTVHYALVRYSYKVCMMVMRVLWM